MDGIFLGVDGGQSSTTALVGDASGRVLGIGRGGPCNHVSGPEARDRFLTAIGGAVADACERAGLGRGHREFASACLGFSGGPADKQPLVEEMFATGRLTMTTDAVIALAGATAGDPGIIVIGGTGSIAFGRNAAGRSARVGGWGYVYGDEGSAFDIGRQALRAALRQHEGWGPRTSLHDILLAETGATDANDLVHRCYTAEWPRQRVARWAPLVDEAAMNGDEVAADILKYEAQQSAAFVASVRRMLFAEGEPARVAHIGGVFRSELLRERFRMLVELTDGNQCGPPLYGPAAGALLEAYRAAGVRVALADVPEEK